jgi:hypothetical protein
LGFFGLANTGLRSLNFGQTIGLAWTDLDVDEQRALAMLKGGVSTELCDPVALLTLTRLGLIRFSRLTAAAEQLLSAAVRQAFAA